MLNRSDRSAGTRRQGDLHPHGAVAAALEEIGDHTLGDHRFAVEQPTVVPDALAVVDCQRADEVRGDQPEYATPAAHGHSLAPPIVPREAGERRAILGDGDVRYDLCTYDCVKAASAVGARPVALQQTQPW